MPPFQRLPVSGRILVLFRLVGLIPSLYVGPGYRADGVEWRGLVENVFKEGREGRFEGLRVLTLEPMAFVETTNTGGGTFGHRSLPCWSMYCSFVYM